MFSNQLIVFAIARVLLCVFTANALYFRYACKPNGDISAINPDSTKYKHAYAFNKVGNCKAEMVNNDTVIKVTECPKGEDAGIINIILNKKSRPFFLIGGKDHKTVSASCSLEKNSYLDRVQISMSAQGLFRNIFGFPPDFYQRPPNVSIEMFDVTGEPGYNVFTISYPIGVVITGPPESDIFPEVCTAYSSKEVGKGLSAVILKNGCSMEHRLMFSFSTQEANWFDRDIDIDEDMTRFVLDGGVHDVMTNGEEEELPPPPKVFTNAYAFRFYLSNYISVHCEVRICPPDSNDCKLPCDTLATTTTATSSVQSTPSSELASSSVSTSSSQATSSLQSEVEALPEPEVNGEKGEAKKSDKIEGDKDFATPKTSVLVIDHSTVQGVDQKVSTTPHVYVDVAASTGKVLMEDLTTEKPNGPFGRRRRDVLRNVKSINDHDISVKNRRSIYGNNFILGKESMKRPHILMDIIVVGPDALIKQLDEMDNDLKVSNEMIGRELPIDAESETRVTGDTRDETPLEDRIDSGNEVGNQNGGNQQATETATTKLSSNDNEDSALDDQLNLSVVTSSNKGGSDSGHVVLSTAIQSRIGAATQKSSDELDGEKQADEESLEENKPTENKHVNQIIMVQAAIKVRDKKDEDIPISISSRN